MAESSTALRTRPVWVDLSCADPAKAREFYATVFGWKIEVNPDPQYGGYAMAEQAGKTIAGIGPKMAPEAPTAWTIYLGTTDADAFAAKVEAAGGKLISAPFDVGPQGRMAVFQDNIGAFIAAWQPREFGSPSDFGWSELNARGVENAIPFYEQVCGWQAKKSDMGGAPAYIEFQVDGESVAGGMEMMPNVPPEVPNFWLAYFAVEDIDAAHKRALDAGARESVAPMDFPGGRFSVLQDPEGATFGLLQMGPR